MKPAELSALLQEGATAARALDQSHSARSKGDDRHEQSAERWQMVARRFEQAMNTAPTAEEVASAAATHLTPERTVPIQDKDVDDALRVMLRSPSYSEGMRDALAQFAQRLLATGGNRDQQKPE
jgi:hypothetical protein